MISKPVLLAALSAAILAASLGGGYYFYSDQAARAAPGKGGGLGATAGAAGQAGAAQAAIAADLRDILAGYRKTIVLLADERSLGEAEKAHATQVGQHLFHDNQLRIARADAALAALAGSADSGRHASLAALLDYIEADPGLYDADRLAFRELLQSLRGHVAGDGSLPAIKLHKRISEDMDALAEIERNYDQEIRQIFGRFEQRGIELKRERWDDYVARLKKLYSREQILKEYGVVMPYSQPAAAPSAPPPSAAGGEPKPEEGEIFGKSLPTKTVVLTFDDGPHKRYSEEIAAILKQYGVPAVFFSVGRNLGTVDAQHKARLNGGADVSRKLKAAGYTLANHSYSHAQLSKESGDRLQAEILDTDVLLKAVDADRSPLFRFPYGARNSEGMAALNKASLRSVMWNIDSLDWADPVPNSIAGRVLQSVEREGRGIILFHDIHERTVKALPAILDRLVAEGYQFAGWDGTAFRVAQGTPAQGIPATAPVSAGYASSWAIVIGIDEYTKWPKLQYAVRDAQGVRQTLIDKFGFAAERVVTLKNGEATRAGILGAFHDRLAHGGVQKNDRIFVFFAGHGATRKLSSGRDLGYIVPVDADPNQLATDAIPMTEIQNIAESLSAKHVLFVMDACYSGLGLTRGGTSSSFLRDNAKRIGRQMLTAGGGDQLVADGGPNGHSVFTWTLLQGLGGKADLNGDGLITATELAAYVAPAVAGVSSQTPAFGSLPGSEGGDFVFELPGETEFLGAGTAQLSNDAIALNSRLDAARPAGAVTAAGAGTGTVAAAGTGASTAGGAATAAAAAPAVAGASNVQPAAIAAVAIKDLQGREQSITPPAAVPVSARQLAQRANDRGLQLYKEKQYAAAEAQFTEALKLRTDFALAANNLGFVFYKQERFPEAARWFENTIRMDPSRAIAYLNLGDASARAGDSKRAQGAYKTYLELAPNGSGAAYARQQLEKL